MFKYEHLYRLEIDDGVSLAEHADDYRHVFNTIRPHEAFGQNLNSTSTSKPATIVRPSS